MKTLLAVLLVATIVSAQQKVPFQNGIPVAPEGLAHRPLPALPLEFDTGEGQRIRVVAVARGIESPFSAAFLPDGSMLVTTRTGQLRIIRNGVLDPRPVAGTPASYWAIESGLPGAVHGYMDIALHPQFGQNGFLYLTYTKPLDEKRRVAALARGKWDGNAITGMKDIFVSDVAATSRIAFGRDGTLYMSMTGNDPQDPNFPQNPNSLGGKVLRLNDDGTIPRDNPFVAARPQA
jgi:aldose sugar dehydrogenase